MINIRHLLVAYTVIEQGSVSAAARSLRVSQPSVTKTLRLVEHELGIVLFERVAGRLQPTPEALLLLPEMKRLASFVGTVQKLADQIKGGRIGKIALATSSTLANSVIAGTASDFRRHWPSVAIELMAYATREVVERVLLNEADFGITDIRVNEPDLIVDPLCRVEVACILPQDHPLAAKDVIVAADLVDEPILAFSETTQSGRAIAEIFRDGSPRFQFAGTVNQSTVACALVEKGAGIALIDPFSVLAGAYRNLALRRFTPTVTIDPVVVRRRDRPLSRFAQVFEQLLRSNLEALARNTEFLRVLPRSSQ